MVADARDLALGPQLKWTFWGDADSPWSAALASTAVFELRHGGRTGGQLLLPLTWHPRAGLWVHANLGTDWAPGSGARTPRGGLGVEWAFHEKLSLIAERFKAGGQWTARAGLRYNLGPLSSVDLTASRTAIDGRHVSGFVLGATHEFSR